VREFLVSEAMHHLGVPTTRALSLVVSGIETATRPWYSKKGGGSGAAGGGPRGGGGDVLQVEAVAITTRAAASFLRVGHFELFGRRSSAARSADVRATARKQLVALIQHALEREAGRPAADTAARRRAAPASPPSSSPSSGGGAETLLAPWEVVRLAAWSSARLAHLAAAWVRVGFVQSNFNSDNCHVAGFTLDFGPFGCASFGTGGHRKADFKVVFSFELDDPVLCIFDTFIMPPHPFVIGSHRDPNSDLLASHHSLDLPSESDALRSTCPRFVEQYDPNFVMWVGGGSHYAFMNQPTAAGRNFGSLAKVLRELLASSTDGFTDTGTAAAEDDASRAEARAGPGLEAARRRAVAALDALAGGFGATAAAELDAVIAAKLGLAPLPHAPSLPPYREPAWVSQRGGGGEDSDAADADPMPRSPPLPSPAVGAAVVRSLWAELEPLMAASGVDWTLFWRELGYLARRLRRRLGDGAGRGLGGGSALVEAEVLDAAGPAEPRAGAVEGAGGAALLGALVEEDLARLASAFVPARDPTSVASQQPRPKVLPWPGDADPTCRATAAGGGCSTDPAGMAVSCAAACLNLRLARQRAARSRAQQPAAAAVDGFEEAGSVVVDGPGHPSWRRWLARWLLLGPDPETMLLANPKFVPREWMLVEAYERAAGPPSSTMPSSTMPSSTTPSSAMPPTTPTPRTRGDEGHHGAASSGALQEARDQEARDQEARDPPLHGGATVGGAAVGDPGGNVGGDEFDEFGDASEVRRLQGLFRWPYAEHAAADEARYYRHAPAGSEDQGGVGFMS
jgi:uncharacterized protein YdiU (UPF0061 family)